MRLLPREEKFYASFLDQAKLICQAATLLLEASRSEGPHMTTVVIKIQTLEQQGDELIHDISTRLNQTFITPLDPEDIHSIASHLDDVLDDIEEAAHCLIAYRLDPVPPTVKEFCEIILSCAEALQKAFAALSKDQPMLEDCIEVNRLEHVADELLRSAVADLFATEKDPIAIIKLKEIYEVLEETTDFCEDVADVLQSVMMKNS